MWQIFERLVIIALIVWSSYVSFVKPHINPLPNESAGYIVHFAPRCGFGCSRFVVPMAAGEFKKAAISDK